VQDGVSPGAWNCGENTTKVTAIKKAETLPEGEFQAFMDEMFAIRRGYDTPKQWKLAHHDVVTDGDSVTIMVNKDGVISAAASLLHGRTIATGEEKKAAADHLLKHCKEMGIDAPEGLEQVADNQKFADLVSGDELYLALDEDFVKKIIDEDTKIESDSISTEAEVQKVLDAIYTIMRPFVKEGTKVDVNEDLYRKLAQSINGAAIGLAAVMNGEGSDLMNLEDNAIMSTMRNQINELKDELTQVKDNSLKVTKERDQLLAKVSDYDAKIEAIGQLSEDVNNATTMVEEINSLNNAKLRFIFDNRSVVDEDIYKEVMGAKSADQLQTIGKWVAKMGSKKVTINSMITDKLVPEPVPSDVSASTDNGVLLQPIVDRDKKSENLDSDMNINNILSLIKNYI
jgi:hypothetical protein